MDLYFFVQNRKLSDMIQKWIGFKSHSSLDQYTTMTEQ